jgi:addiction module HigA family antidote
MIAVHPGRILRSEIDARGLTTLGFARAVGVIWWQLNALLDGRMPMTKHMAKRLAEYFGNSSGFWERLQQDYDRYSRRDRKV